MQIAEGASAGASIANAISAASSGATFSIQIGASGSDNTYTARLDGDAAEGGYSMASLISDLNAVDKSSFAEANKVSFEAGDDGAILVKFDNQGANTTAVTNVSYDPDGTSMIALLVK